MTEAPAGNTSDPLQLYNKMVQDIQSCNSIKYAAYRTASKMLILQKSLCFDKVSLKVIRGIFEQHHVRTTDNYLFLGTEEIENILYDIFFAASREGNNLNVELCMEVSKLFLNNLFRNAAQFNVLNLKVVLVCICSSSLYSKYQYCFSQLVDHNLCLPRRRFHVLLQALLIITNYLSESNTFTEALIQPTVNSCFLKSSSTCGINENDFMSWLGKEPQILVWLSTFYRLSISSNVIHNIQCAVCGVFPIIGLRYHCLRCICYDLCQKCFFTARTSKNHKSRHMIREYCSQTSLYETATTFFKEIFKRLCGHEEKLQYLPVDPSCFKKKVSDDIHSPCNSKNMTRMPTDKNNENIECKARLELQNMLSTIEKEARILSESAGDIPTICLIKRQTLFLQDQLNRIMALQCELIKINELTENNSENSIVGSNTTLNLVERESVLCIPSSSGFSSWLENTSHETTYTKKLHSDLENIMSKLNKMLESNVSISRSTSMLSSTDCRQRIADSEH